MKIRAWLLLALLPAGCPQQDMTAKSGDTSFDGVWQLRSTTGQSPACITIQGGQIVEFRQGCSGALRAVVDLTGVSTNGSSVSWTFTVLVDGVVDTLALTGNTQSDGSITGLVNGTVGGQVVSSAFTMTRQ